MAVLNITVSTLEPTIASYAAAGLSAPLPGEKARGFEILYSLLGGTGDMPQVVTAINGSAYIPKVYRGTDGPVLQWGTQALDLSAVGGANISYQFATANTGYPGPHIVFLS
ncbi:MAG: hypothetical protein HC888_15235, partial [Candidatus Competibacteraceae bacterium]|nr:hypothetical protein [Candidatus Competibacteraceae bacterium]